MPSGPASRTAASQSRRVWSSSSSRWVRQVSSLMTAAYCPRYGGPSRTARCLLPGAVGPGTPPVAPELLDLGPHVGKVDGGRNEGDDREERDQLHAVRETAQADDGRHAKDDQPDRLGLLAGRGERGGRPTQGVNEGPRFDDKRRQHEHFKEPEEWGQSPATEHPSRLSAIGDVCARLAPKGTLGGCARAHRADSWAPERRGQAVPWGIGRPIPQSGRGQDLVDREWLCLPLSAPLAWLLRPLSARFPRLASLSYSLTARTRAVVTYSFARPDREPTEAWSRHLASRAGSSRSVSEASTPTPAAACTGLLSASLRISVLTSMVRFTNLTLLACRFGRPFYLARRRLGAGALSSVPSGSASASVTASDAGPVARVGTAPGPGPALPAPVLPLRMPPEPVPSGPGPVPAERGPRPAPSASAAVSGVASASS